MPGLSHDLLPSDFITKILYAFLMHLMFISYVFKKYNEQSVSAVFITFKLMMYLHTAVMLLMARWGNQYI